MFCSILRRKLFFPADPFSGVTDFVILSLVSNSENSCALRMVERKTSFNLNSQSMSYRQEEVVASVDDLQDGEMKEVTVNETPVLLSRVNGNFYAIHGHCSHYGASLAQGALHGTRVICPWHHACFDVTTGQQQEAPGLDSVPTYEVTVENDQVRVRLPEETPKPTATPNAPTDSAEHTVIIGGGAAATHAVQAMRAIGYAGKITMITGEDHLPYDRTALSKKFLQGNASADELRLREVDFYRENAIQINPSRVSQLDAQAKTVRLADGETITYDRALLSSGSQVNTLDVPGADYPNVYTLRTLSDSEAIKKAAQSAQEVVVVGASFIGMECATSLQALGGAVTVVAPDTYPFASKWGERIGKMIRSLHEAEGIQFRAERKVEKIEGDTHARRVVLDNGEVLPADLVVVGIGVHPATDFVTGLKKADDGGIVVDKYLHAGQAVYAAGDIAQFPYGGQSTRIEHWRLAAQQGTVAGRNLAGKEEVLDRVPFFWTAQQGKNIRYVGHAESYDEIIYQGEVEEQDFIAFFIKDKTVRAALGMNRDAALAAIEHLMYHDRMPELSAIRQDEVQWTEELKDKR